MTHHWGYVGAITSALLFGIGTKLNKLSLAKVNPNGCGRIGLVIVLGIYILYKKK